MACTACASRCGAIPPSRVVSTWRSAKIRVSEDTLAGRGVVAVADIARDEIVAIKAGHIVTADEIEQVTAAAGDLALQIEA